MILKKIKKLALKDITIDNPWLFWAENPSANLVTSLKNFGQLEPVLVCSKNSHFFLVHGYQRCLALHKLEKSILALEIEAQSEKDLGLIYFTLNPEKRTAYHLVKAFRFWQKTPLTQEELALIGLNPKTPLYQNLLFWLTLPTYWDELLLKDHFDLNNASWLKKFNLPELESLYPLLKGAKWSKNNLRQFITLTFELKAKGHSWTSLTSNLLAFLNKKLSPQDLQAKILQYLKELRYPTLNRFEKKLQKYLKELSAGTTWKIQHPNNLENQTLIFQNQVNNLQELEEAHKTLQKISKQNPWQKWEEFLDE